MFEEFMDLPLHPLLVHAVVVFVPLLALTAVAHAFIPVVRTHIRWVVGLLAVATPAAAVVTKLAGDALFDRMDAGGGVTEHFYPVLEEHQQLGTNTMWASIALGLLALALAVFLTPRDPVLYAAGGSTVRQLLLLGVRILVVAAAAVSLYYVFRAGDSGARAVWESNYQQWVDNS